jgi:LCP family protein required for cell wall assembly
MMNNRNKILIASGVVILALAAAMVGETYANNMKADSVRRADSYSTDEASVAGASRLYERDSFDGSIVYEGTRYEMNSHIDTVLFLGIDSSSQEREGIGITEGGRSDTIILFVIDNDNQIITPLEINRDTMVDVDIYDNDGSFLAKGTEQLTMQYAYGNTPQKASNLTREKVSDLLGRKRIGSVLSLTMDGIEPIVDSIGGVTLTLSSDETDLDPSYKKGATIHLDGAAAKAFVHNRDVETRGSNISRMSRQTQFMLAMFQTIKSQGSSVVETMEDAAGDYLYQDIDADSIDHMTRYEYSGDVLNLPGENVEGAIHDEFYVDEDKLTELILDLFYIRS